MFQEMFQVKLESYSPLLLGIRKLEKADSAELKKQKKKLHRSLTRTHKCAKSVIGGFSNFDLIDKLWPILCRF